ncbi:MAG: DUF839 domain-containing protein, partial [Rhizobacter sp.]|nr:DUF839 domain-containing protein [Rhizobacter sp.]
MNQPPCTAQRDRTGQDRFADIAERSPGRRELLRQGASVMLAALLGPVLPAAAYSRTPSGSAAPKALFDPVEASTADTVRVPAGYRVQVVYAWGDPIDGVGPAF